MSRLKCVSKESIRHKLFKYRLPSEGLRGNYEDRGYSGKLIRQTIRRRDNPLRGRLPSTWKTEREVYVERDEGGEKSYLKLFNGARWGGTDIKSIKNLIYSERVDFFCQLPGPCLECPLLTIVLLAGDSSWQLSRLKCLFCRWAEL